KVSAKSTTSFSPPPLTGEHERASRDREGASVAASLRAASPSPPSPARRGRGGNSESLNQSPRQRGSVRRAGNPATPPDSTAAPGSALRRLRSQESLAA